MPSYPGGWQRSPAVSPQQLLYILLLNYLPEIYTEEEGGGGEEGGLKSHLSPAPVWSERQKDKPAKGAESELNLPIQYF